LVTKTGEDVLAREVFSRFKSYADFESKISMLELLEQICNSAKVYASIYALGNEHERDLDRTALFAYRLKVLGLDVVRPLFLYLVDPDEGQIPQPELEKCLEIIESWLIRRMLARVTSKSYNKIIPEIISKVRENRENAALVLENYFKSQHANTSYWPDDEEVRKEITSLAFYDKIYRSRVRMILEALEDDARGWRDGKTSSSGMRIKKGSYTIEHLMPQKWQKHWPLTEGVNELERDSLVQTLGNLTLLSTKLNSSVSNGPWLGNDGKSPALTQHDVLLLNKRVQEAGINGWNEESIRTRTQELIEAILSIWRVPTGHVSKVRRERNESSKRIQVIDLISAGLIEPGQKIYPHAKKYTGISATILADGRIELNGVVYDSLSGAGVTVRGSSTNGWRFFAVEGPSGPRLSELYDRYVELAGVEDSFESLSDESEDG
jgi:hypothetical protein